MKKLGFVLVSFLLLVGCKKEPVSWNSSWNLPLINDTLDLLDYVNDSTIVNNAGFYSLELKRTLLDLNLNDLIEIPDTTLEENYVSAFTNLTINPGFSFVNSTEEHNIEIENVELKKIILKSGHIDITVKNPIGTVTIFNVTLPGVEKDGVIFNRQYSAPAGTNANPGVVTKSIDLTGYSIDLTGVSGSSFNKFQSQITVSSSPTGPTVVMTNQDITRVKASFKDLKVSYAKGYFGDRIFSDSTILNIKELNAYQGGLIDLPSTSVKFNIENSIKVIGEGKLHYITNENQSGNIISLTHPQIGSSLNIDAASGSWGTLMPSIKTIEFNSANSNIESYLENLGSIHKIGYTIKINPWGNISGGWDELFPSSKIKVNLEALMPLAIGMDNLKLRDTFNVDLNSDPEKTVIKSGDLILQSSNGFPFSSKLKLFFLDDSGNLLHEVTGSSEIGSSQFGTFDSQHSMNIKKNEIRFVLSEAVLSDQNNIKRIVVESAFNSINPATGAVAQALIPSGAFLAFKLKTEFVTENKF